MGNSAVKDVMLWTVHANPPEYLYSACHVVSSFYSYTAQVEHEMVDEWPEICQKNLADLLITTALDELYERIPMELRGRWRFIFCPPYSPSLMLMVAKRSLGYGCIPITADVSEDGEFINWRAVYEESVRPILSSKLADTVQLSDWMLRRAAGC